MAREGGKDGRGMFLQGETPDPSDNCWGTDITSEICSGAHNSRETYITVTWVPEYMYSAGGTYVLRVWSVRVGRSPGLQAA